jgi:hypothetical protein
VRVSRLEAFLYRRFSSSTLSMFAVMILASLAALLYKMLQ